MEINVPDLIVRGDLDDDESWVAFFKDGRLFEISYHGIEEGEFEYDPIIYCEVSFEQAKAFIEAVFGSIERFFEKVDEVCS